MNNNNNNNNDNNFNTIEKENFNPVFIDESITEKVILYSKYKYLFHFYNIRKRNFYKGKIVDFYYNNDVNNKQLIAVRVVFMNFDNDYNYDQIIDFPSPSIQKDNPWIIIIESDDEDDQNNNDKNSENDNHNQQKDNNDKANHRRQQPQYYFEDDDDEEDLLDQHFLNFFDEDIVGEEAQHLMQLVDHPLQQVQEPQYHELLVPDPQWLKLSIIYNIYKILFNIL